MRELSSEEEKDPLNVFKSWGEVKRVFQRLKQDFERDGDGVVFPMESWVKTGEDTRDLIIQATELLAEIVNTQEYSYQYVQNYFKQEKISASELF